MNKLMTRRTAISKCLITMAGFAAPSFPTHAALPILWQVLGIAARLLIGNAVRVVAKEVIPGVVATATRRFLFGVALAYGISEAQAAIVSWHAERAGAETVARGDVHHDISLSLTNTQDRPMVFRAARVELVNLETGLIEDEMPLATSVPANATINLPLTVKRFKGEGLRQLRFVAKGHVFAVGPKFWGFTA